MTRQYRLVFAAGLAILAASGCYTQFSTLQEIAPQREVVVDSAGDTVSVVRRVDTIVTREREVCVWERDFLGYPRLRCYETNYSRDYYMYNSSPWWYRNDPHWYDYDRCPRYYYYDRNCGCCKYYREDPYYYRSPSGSGGGSSSGSGSSPRSRSHGVPGSATQAPSTSDQLGKAESDNAAETPPSVPPQVVPEHKPGRSRSSGIPDASSKPTDGTTSSQAKTAADDSAVGVPLEQAESKEAEGIQSPLPLKPAAVDSGSSRPQRSRRNPRSW